jgi:hypothetical protein
MEEIIEICNRHGIKIMEDAAHAFPTRYNGKMIGTFSDITCFSFYANKTITTGEGGMLVTNDENIYKRVKTMRLHGINRDIWDRFTSKTPSWEYDVIDAGYKYNMPDLAAAIGLGQLEKAELFRSERQKAVEFYYENLVNLPMIDLPICNGKLEDHAWHLFPIVLNDKSAISRNEYINATGMVTQNVVGTSADKQTRLFFSQFNSDWAGKLLIVVDEVLLNRREDSERLKNLSTTLSYKVEAKGKDRDEIAFFAKFVLCSNNEYLPVIIDAGETRYWVRKIERLQSDDTDFLQKLKAEIPAFLHFLQHRQLSSEKESRMWFAPSLLHTEALQKIIRSNRNRLEIEMQELILDIMDSVGTDTFSFCYNDLLLLLVHSQVKVEKHQVRKVLQECWKLTPAPNTHHYT